MKITRLILIGIMFFFAKQAFAYQECDNIYLDKQYSVEKLRDKLLNRIPVKHLQEGVRIQLYISRNSTSLFPRTNNKANQIILTTDFLVMACRIVITEFLSLSGVELDIINLSAETAAACLEQKSNVRKCFTNFALQRAQAYKPYFDQLTNRDKSTALNILVSVVNQIIIHEYAHFFLDHLERINQNKIKRIDAEFEADFFAVMNGIESAEPASAMYYFFRSFEDIQYYTDKLDTVEYESGACRAKNIGNITSVVGIEPMLIVDAAASGGLILSRNNPQMIRESHNNRFDQAPQFSISNHCGRLEKMVLLGAYDELKKLFRRIDKDLDYLFATDKGKNINKARNLITDLSTMSVQFRYLHGIAAKSIAAFLREWGLKGRKLSPIVSQVDAILKIKDEDNNYLSGDYGRILLTRGLAVVQEQSHLERSLRLKTARRLLEASVYYNPALAEAWMNLALVSLEQANCKQAEKYTYRSLETLTDESMRESTQFFADAMRNLANNPAGCSEMAATFSPYPGL